MNKYHIEYKGKYGNHQNRSQSTYNSSNTSCCGIDSDGRNGRDDNGIESLQLEWQ